MRNYRGMTKEGKWVYGWYVFDVEWAKHYIYNSADFTRGAFYILGRHEVLPETVGQQVGLKDKNGKEAYKSNIALDEFGQKWEMTWDDECACFCLILAGETLDTVNEEEILYARAIKAMEIIGNIHENPELLT